MDIETLTLPDSVNASGLNSNGSLDWEICVSNNNNVISKTSLQKKNVVTSSVHSARHQAAYCPSRFTRDHSGSRVGWSGTAASEHVFGIDADGTKKARRERWSVSLNHERFRPGDRMNSSVITSSALISVYLSNDVWCRVLPSKPLMNLSEYRVRGVFDTMHAGGLERNVTLASTISPGHRNRVKQDLQVEGSKVFDLYHAGRLEDS